MTHFFCHHGKATAMFTGTGSFHRRVQCEQIGLEGQTVHDGGNVCNLLGLLVDGTHALCELFHKCMALLGRMRSVVRHAIGILRQAAGLLHDAEHSGGSVGGFFQRAAGSFRAYRQIAAAALDGLGGGMQLGHAVGDGAHNAVQLHNQLLQIKGQRGLHIFAGNMQIKSVAIMNGIHQGL